MILYGSRYGSVREYVQWIQTAGGSHEGPFCAYDVKKQRREARNAFAQAEPTEPVLIVAPVYAGQIMKPVRYFVEEHSDEIRRHRLALAMTTLYQGEKAREELIRAYPAALVAHAAETFFIGGRIRPAELPFLVRHMVKKIIGSTEELNTLDYPAATTIAEWLG